MMDMLLFERRGSVSQSDICFLITSTLPEKIPSRVSHTIILGDGYKDTPESVISIYEYINSQKTLIRSRVIDWLESTSNVFIGNSPLIDYLRIEPRGESLWLHSVFNRKDISVHDRCLRKIVVWIAINELIRELQPRRILVSCDVDIQLRKAISLSAGFCQRPDNLRGFRLEVLSKLTSRFNFLVFSLYPFYWIIVNLRSLVFFIRQREIVIEENRSVIFTYQSSIRSRDGVTHDCMWQPLIDLLGFDKVKTIMISNLFFTGISIPDRLAWQRLICRHNVSPIESHLTLSVLCRAVLLFWKIRRRYPLIISTLQKSLSIKPGLLLLSKSLQSSFSGSELFNNLIYYLLIQRLAVNFSSAPTDIFLPFENQSWENSVVGVYSNCFPDLNIFGYSNTVLRFWDLRFRSNTFYSEQSRRLFRFLSSDKRIVSENILAVQSNVVESLRYSGYKSSKTNRSLALNKPIEVLILGEYVEEDTLFLLDLVLSSLAVFDSDLFSLTFKPHPANIESVASLAFICRDSVKIDVESTLIELCNSAALAITGPTSASVVDISILGCPCISIVKPDDINMSLMNEISPELAIASQAGLIKYLSELLVNMTFSRTNSSRAIEDIICIDSTYKRWSEQIFC